MSRAAAILQALQREVQLRRQLLDSAEDLAEVEICIKLQAGTNWIRATTYREERVVRARDNRST